MMNVYTLAGIGMLGTPRYHMRDFCLTVAQRQRLEQQLRQTRDVRVYRRTLALLEAAAGQPIAAIARLLRTSRPSVYHWLESYRGQPDPSTLADHRGGNHAPLWSEPLQALLVASLERPPDDFGYPAVFWTVPLLQEHLAHYGGVRPGATSLRQRQRKKRCLRQQLRCLPPHWVKLFEDETDLLLFPPLRAAWGRRGEPLTVQLSGANARRVVFGAINMATGRRLYLGRHRQRSEDFCAVLRLVAYHYRGRRVALVLDEDPSHTARPSQALATELGIRLLWLPKRAPELNGMDHLWGHGKDHVCADRQYPSIAQQVERFVTYLAGLSDQDALRQAGLRSEQF